MSAQSVVLTDVSAGTYVESIDWQPSSELRLFGSDCWSLKKRRMRGGLSDGVDVVELNNGALSVEILPTRGMGLWRGRYRGLELGWKSPVAQPVHPAFVNLSDRGGLAWLSGFNEWLCRCGLNSFGPPGVDQVKDGAGKIAAEIPLTLHGKVANLAAHRVTAEIDPAGPGTLRVTGEVDETMLFGPCLRLKSTVESKAGSNCLTIIDEVTNLAGVPGELCLLYHINVGGPFLEAQSKLVGSFEEVAPRDAHAGSDIDRYSEYLPPTPGYREQCYFFRPVATNSGQAVFLLRNAAGDQGMSVRFDPRELPWLTQWKNTQGERDGYCTGIEPGTGFPNLRTFEREQGRVVTLPPGGTWKARIDLVIHPDRASVAEAEAETKAGTVLREPRKDWTAGL